MPTLLFNNHCMCMYHLCLRLAQFLYIRDCKIVLDSVACNDVSFSENHVHQQRGKTTTGSALDGAVLDFTQILAYLVHNMSRFQLYFGFCHFG